MVNQAAESGRLVLYSSKDLDVTKKLPGKDLLSNVEWVKNDAEVNKKIGQDVDATKCCFYRYIIGFDQLLLHVVGLSLESTVGIFSKNGLRPAIRPEISRYVWMGVLL